ncbi:hypothetical protein XENTR_v10002660 [Xenopus tropicalis]|nr:hypothetical protein XENTR_v10002660 [Xenopus tropicalis]
MYRIQLKMVLLSRMNPLYFSLDLILRANQSHNILKFKNDTKLCSNVYGKLPFDAYRPTFPLHYDPSAYSLSQNPAFRKYFRSALDNVLSAE